MFYESKCMTNTLLPQAFLLWLNGNYFSLAPSHFPVSACKHITWKHKELVYWTNIDTVLLLLDDTFWKRGETKQTSFIFAKHWFIMELAKYKNATCHRLTHQQDHLLFSVMLSNYQRPVLRSRIFAWRSNFRENSMFPVLRR